MHEESNWLPADSTWLGIGMPAARGMGLGSQGALNLQTPPAPMGKGAEATLQQLEADFAKLRSALAAESHPTEGKSSEPGPTWPIDAPSVPWGNPNMPGASAAAHPSRSLESGARELYSRPLGLPAAGVSESVLQTDTSATSRLNTQNVDEWRQNLWRTYAQQHSRREGDVSRLYDELLRLEEEDSAMNRPRPNDLDVLSKSDTNAQGRRRVLSGSSLRNAKPGHGDRQRGCSVAGPR